MPQVYDASKEWKGKKIVLVSVPGAFTPGCQARHLPPYINNLDKLIENGVDLVAVIAFNDSFVMQAWGKVNGVKVGSFVPPSGKHARLVANIIFRTHRR